MAAPDLSWTLPEALAHRVDARIARLRDENIVQRIWDRDATVWTGSNEGEWLGWLDLPNQDRAQVDRAVALAREMKAEGVASIVLLGMGGSSLAPEVLHSIIGRSDNFPILHVLDSTDPEQIASLERAIDVSRAVFLVASKSGTTLEVNILKDYFFHRAVDQLGEAQVGRRFVLTTDPGSKLESVANREGFRAVFPGIASVGGRYSALSNFGLLPAALIGGDPAMLLDRALDMARRCASEGPDNTAFELGAVLGELALGGRDKPTLIASPSVASFGAWLEQLMAESLGKQGKGIIPVAGESLSEPDAYGSDRVFVHLKSAAGPDAASDAIAERLERAGQPMIRIEWPDRHALGAEFFRWEFATAVAGAVLGVNPFDQPDVESAKAATRRLALEYEQAGTLQDEVAPMNDAAIAALLKQLSDGDYFAILAFIEMNQEHANALDAIRALVRDRWKVATTVGFGPRYLHSTGQAHKGGPNTGVFLMITCDHAVDLQVPGQAYTFGTIERLQARGDYAVLAERRRRVLRVHLTDTRAGLSDLHASVQRNSQMLQ